MDFILISRFHAHRKAIFPSGDGNFIPRTGKKCHTEVRTVLTHVTSFRDYKNFNFPFSRTLATFFLEEGNLIALNCRTWNTEATCYATGSAHVFDKNYRNVPQSCMHIALIRGLDVR
jgi:hypothetical protein